MIVTICAIVVAVSFLVTPSCTIIRYVDNNENNGNSTTLDPKVVDMLVMVELNRSTVSLAADYQKIIGELVAGLALKHVTVRKVALAPMYRRTGEVVPLIYGLNDDDAEFGSYAEAIAFFANDDGQRYLTVRSEADGKNLADLGRTLDTRPIYHPTTADSQGRPYFTEPADGFIVLSLTAKARSCGYDDAGCRLGGQEPAAYLTAEGANGLEWLTFSGGAKLPRERVFHLSVATSERLSGSEFDAFCKGQQGFPASKLDFIEPSALSYYEPLTSKLKERDAPARYVDLCVAMSLNGTVELASAAGEIAGMF
jgi:hypothetical protein